ncbi:tyrosine phosphatase [Xylariomycetidae sp. FL2044]|nr:tyrosine phosphatase [Xylariomycetidae sp. FL2044]
MAAAPLPCPPFFNVSGVNNFRDAGGYPIDGAPGKMVRRMVVFRSMDPSGASEDGITRLRWLGITHVYDLRSAREFDGSDGGRQRVKEWRGANRVHVPVFRKQDYTPEAIARRNGNYGSGASGFVKTYMHILEAGSSIVNDHEPFETILAHLSSATPPTPLLIHCAAGKDRTGVICALILSLCGVSDEIVAHEYSLTDMGLKPVHEAMLANLLKESAFQDQPQKALKMVQARKKNMLGTLKLIREKWGSVEDCVQELGIISAEGIDRLRRNMIVDASPAMPAVEWEEHARLVRQAWE